MKFCSFEESGPMDNFQNKYNVRMTTNHINIHYNFGIAVPLEYTKRNFSPLQIIHVIFTLSFPAIVMFLAWILLSTTANILRLFNPIQIFDLDQIQGPSLCNGNHNSNKVI